MANLARIMTHKDEIEIVASMTHAEISEYLDHQAESVAFMMDLQVQNIITVGYDISE